MLRRRMARAWLTFSMSTMPWYFDQESMGWMEGYFLASERSRERPWKAPTTFSVAWVTGSSKLPPAGETVPPMVMEAVLPSWRRTLPARS